MAIGSKVQICWSDTRLHHQWNSQLGNDVLTLDELKLTIHSGLLKKRNQ